MPAGYSGTPLTKKLGIKSGHYVATRNEPDEFRALLGDLPDEASMHTRLGKAPDVVIGFYVREKKLVADLARISAAIHPDRAAWVAWPKKTSGVETDLTGDVVRARVLETSLVDVKVCAISDTWSGLKVVWRKELRG